ncbi:MAG: hypothetical protein ABI886_02365 [Betaproteobacteria bacterium]
MGITRGCRSLSPLMALVAALGTWPVLAAPAVVHVPPTTYDGAASPKAAVAQRLVPDGSPRRLIALAAPGATEAAGMKAANAARSAPTRASGPGSRKGRPLTIGFGRELQAADGVLQGAALPWQPVAGGYAARIDVASVGAAALRIALTMQATDPRVTLRFSGSAPGAPAPEAVAANDVARSAAEHGVWWSPVLEGATATIELHAPAGVPRDAIALTLARVSHLAIAGADLARIDAKRVTEIGQAGACEIDVACVTPTPTQALRDAASSVVQIVFTLDDGRTGLCTGTLLNDTVDDRQPYVYAANHCLDRQSVAATVNTYWFFDAVSCGSLTVPPYVLLAGGATLLARSQDDDWALVRLNRTPPSGAKYSAWTSEPVAEFAVANTIHHPEGDLKKWSQGSVLGTLINTDIGVNGLFTEVIWNQGSTEAGSSGAGLFTIHALGGYYELRGGLSAGNASCSFRAGYDLFTRMEAALPLLRGYLTPDAASPGGLVPAVEFYAKSLDHYFISTNPVEIEALDTGAIPGWVRTGLRFLAWSSPAQAPAGTNPVCRFYLRPGFGDSHFYSGSPAECAATALKFGSTWIYESPSVFYIQLPNAVTGACPANTAPVYRFFNTATTNHRYTTQKTVRDELRLAPNWLPEGYGPDAVIMCSPTG